MPECHRCGECCRRGGPTLMQEDAPLLREGWLPLDAVVCLRAGEWARHDGGGSQTTAFVPGKDNVAPLSVEMLKLAGAGDSVHPWRCRYLDSADGVSVCTVHAHRPLQCRTLFCRDTAPLEQLMERGNFLHREQLFALLAEREPRAALWAQLARAHEEACSAVEYFRCCAETSDTARARRAEMERYDRAFRELCVERQALAPDLLPLVLGRPLAALPRP